MKPFEVDKLPIQYTIDKELISLISEANLKYGEYKSNLKNSQFDSRFFLDSIILSESLKSTQIEGTQISQNDMYYLKYIPKTDDNLEIQNLKKVIEYSKNYLKENDKIAVCISGGKDSFLMAKLFQEIMNHGNVKFECRFICMDPGYKEENRKLIEENAKKLNIPIEIFNSDIFEASERASRTGQGPCYLCARMRRGALYTKAKELGCNKIALGHHFDDVIETILLNMFYGSTVKSMMPKLHSDNFKGIELIRPLYLVEEESIICKRRTGDCVVAL